MRNRLYRSWAPLIGNDIHASMQTREDAARFPDMRHSGGIKGRWSIADEGVGNFVRVVRLGREDLGHVVGGLCDHLNKSGGIGAGAEALLELGREGLPKSGVGFSDVALVVDDCEFLRFGGDEDEGSIPQGGAIHPEAGEGFPSGGKGVSNGLAGHVNAELATGLLLQRLDGLGNVGIMDFKEELFGFHGVLPASAGAASAAAAASA